MTDLFTREIVWPGLLLRGRGDGTDGDEVLLGDVVSEVQSKIVKSGAGGE